MQGHNKHCHGENTANSELCLMLHGLTFPVLFLFHLIGKMTCRKHDLLVAHISDIVHIYWKKTIDHHLQHLSLFIYLLFTRQTGNMLLQYRIVAYYSNIFNNKCITI